MEINAWTGLGGSWGRLRSHLNSQGRLARKNEARKPKNNCVWAPILGSMSDMFHDFAMFFGIVFSVSILMATKTDFSWILITILIYFNLFSWILITIVDE